MSGRARAFGVWPCAALAAAVLAALAVFGQVAWFDFAYDDEWTIVKNRYLRWPLLPVLSAAFTGEGAALSVPDASRPAMLLSTWLDFHVFGLSPAGHHVHSLVWYLACCALAPLAAHAWTRRRVVAVVAGLWFAVSPLHAEAVASVNYREDLIAGLSVLSIVAWVLWPSRRHDSALSASGVATVFMLGLLGKASAAAVVPLLAVWFALSRGRYAIWRRRRASIIALGVSGAVWAAWRGALRFMGLDGVPLKLDAIPLGDRLARAARFEVRALVDTLWPVSWAPDYPREGAAGAGWVLAIVLVVVCGWVLAKQRHTTARSLVLGLTWVLVAPLVASPLIGPINERADRYLFVSVLGAGCVLGALVDAAVGWLSQGRDPRRSNRGVRLAMVFAGGLAVGPASEAIAATQVWQTNPVLWRAAVRRRPDAARAWAALSRQLRLEGDLDAADRAVARAIELDPGLLRARVTRLYNMLARGAVSAAQAQIIEIQRLGGEDQLGMALARRCARLDPEAAAMCASGRYRWPPEVRPGRAESAP